MSVKAGSRETLAKVEQSHTPTAELSEIIQDQVGLDDEIQDDVDENRRKR